MPRAREQRLRLQVLVVHAEQTALDAERLSSGTMPRITYSAPYRPALERKCSTWKSADIGELAVESS